MGPPCSYGQAFFKGVDEHGVSPYQRRWAEGILAPLRQHVEGAAGDAQVERPMVMMMVHMIMMEVAVMVVVW